MQECPPPPSHQPPTINTSIQKYKHRISYCKVTEHMVPKVQHARPLPSRHMNEVIDVSLLVDLSRLQFGNPPPCGRHRRRVEGTERPEKERKIYTYMQLHWLSSFPGLFELRTRQHNRQALRLTLVYYCKVFIYMNNPWTTSPWK